MQTRDAVVFFSESLHDARILRLDGPPSAGGRHIVAGASIARWEGDTLVVETRNFKADQNLQGRLPDLPQTVIVERFTLHSHDG